MWELVRLVKPVRVNGRQSKKQVFCSRVCVLGLGARSCSVLFENPILNLLLRVTHEEGEFVDFCRLCLFKRSRAFVRILHVMQISFYDAPAASEIV